MHRRWDLHPEDLAGYASGRMGLEIKAFAVKDLDLKESGEVVVAVAETGSVDREGDYSFPGFMPQKDLPISAYAHSSWPQKGGLLPTGRGTIKEDGNLAVFRGQFFMNTTHGRDTYETVKAMKELQEWSYGYEVKEKAQPPAGIKAKRGLKLVEPFEISPVLIGAGNRTFTMGIKSGDEGDLEPDELLTLLKDGSLAGLTFAEMNDRVLGGIEAYVERLGAIAALRLKEGRALSAARLEALASGRGRLAEALAAIDKVIAEATPAQSTDEDTEGKARLMRLRSRLGQANVEFASLQH